MQTYRVPVGKVPAVARHPRRDATPTVISAHIGRRSGGQSRVSTPPRSEANVGASHSNRSDSRATAASNASSGGSGHSERHAAVRSGRPPHVGGGPRAKLLRLYLPRVGSSPGHLLVISSSSTSPSYSVELGRPYPAGVYPVAGPVAREPAARRRRGAGRSSQRPGRESRPGSSEVVPEGTAPPPNATPRALPAAATSPSPPCAVGA